METPVAETATVLPDLQVTSAGGPIQSTTAPTEGMVVDHYRLIRQLGQGGMGVVWEAVDDSSGRHVALKLLSSGLTSDSSHVERFLREARLAASLSHPRSTFVFGAGQHHDAPYIVMELMPGDTLQQIVEGEGQLSSEAAVDYMLDVIDGLQSAHDLGIIHRDVKPSNCFIDGDGRVKVGDFGLSKSLVSDAQLTRTGAFLGTPLYAAPEQIRGGEVDERTDVYAVAATLFFLLTGEGPFQGDAVSVIAQIASDPPRRLREVVPNASPALEKIISHALQKQPEKRFRNLAELRNALTPFSSSGSGIADVWRRLAAYFIDSIAFGAVAGIVITFVNAAMIGFLAVNQTIEEPSSSERYTARINQSNDLTLTIVHLIVLALCFALVEWRWGRGVGKWIMGLKVVDYQGSTPRFWQMLIRVIFIPVAFGLPTLPLLLDLPVNVDANSPNSLDGFSSNLLILAVLLSLVPQLFMAACFITVRRSNGYRAIHDLLSRTRVVRIGEGVFKASRIVLPKPVQEPSSFDGKTFGPFVVTGQLSECPSKSILTANDSLLDRAAWIRVTSVDEEANESVAMPSHPIRATRAHWLQSGRDDQYSWEAFEAVDGAPIGRAIQALAKNKWQRAAIWVHELAEELCESCKDGTLPPELQLDQVWVDNNDKVKLLDEPIGAHAMANFANQETEHLIKDGIPSERAIHLLQRVMEESTRNEILGLDTSDFAAELATREPNLETLEWARQELATICKKPRILTWDNRLGSIAISTSGESSVYALPAMLLVFCAVTWLGFNPLLSGTLVAILSLGLCAALAFHYRGGVVFHYLGIDCVTGDGERASRLRCAIRGVLSWLPWILAMNAVWIFITYLISVGEIPEQNQRDWQTIAVVSCLLIAVVCLAINGIGIVFAIVSPRRAIQDYICGTRLVPK